MEVEKAGGMIILKWQRQDLGATHCLPVRKGVYENAGLSFD